MEAADNRHLYETKPLKTTPTPFNYTLTDLGSDKLLCQIISKGALQSFLKGEMRLPIK